MDECVAEVGVVVLEGRDGGLAVGNFETGKSQVGLSGHAAISRLARKGGILSFGEDPPRRRGGGA